MLEEGRKEGKMEGTGGRERRKRGREKNRCRFYASF